MFINSDTHFTYTIKDGSYNLAETDLIGVWFLLQLFTEVY